MSTDFDMGDDLRIDFTEVEDQKEFTNIPPSKQNVMVTDWDKGEVGASAKNAGATKLTFEFTVQDGEYASRRIWDTFTLVENSLWKLKAFLAAIGEDVSGSLSLTPEEYLGRNLVIKLGIQPARKGADGSEYPARNNVKGYYPEAEDSDNGNLMP
jgi:hypothetical protein